MGVFEGEQIQTDLLHRDHLSVAIECKEGFQASCTRSSSSDHYLLARFIGVGVLMGRLFAQPIPQLPSETNLALSTKSCSLPRSALVRCFVANAFFSDVSQCRKRLLNLHSQDRFGIHQRMESKWCICRFVALRRLAWICFCTSMVIFPLKISADDSIER